MAKGNKHDPRYGEYDKLFTELAQAKLFNGNISVLEKGEVLYENYLGIKNKQTDEFLNEDTVFELASVSKAFTAMAIMILVERGKLRYETLISKYFPNLPYEMITIQHLLSHTSGLPDYMGLFEKHWNREKIAENQDIVDLLVTYQPKALFAPGESCEYSNTAYALLALIVEQVAGVPYRDFLQKEIFDVLEMHRTRVHNGRLTGETIPNYAAGHFYDRKADQYVFPEELAEHDYVIYLDGIQGDGVVNSNLSDLKKWDRALYTEKLVKKATMEQAFSSIADVAGENFSYGNGWRVVFDELRGHYVYHGGSWPGYRNWFTRYLKDDKTIIYLTNVERTRAFTEALVEAIDRILYGLPYEIPEEK